MNDYHLNLIHVTIYFTNLMHSPHRKSAQILNIYYDTRTRRVFFFVLLLYCTLVLDFGISLSYASLSIELLSSKHHNVNHVCFSTQFS